MTECTHRDRIRVLIVGAIQRIRVLILGAVQRRRTALEKIARVRRIEFQREKLIRDGISELHRCVFRTFSRGRDFCVHRRRRFDDQLGERLVIRHPLASRHRTGIEILHHASENLQNRRIHSWYRSGVDTFFGRRKKGKVAVRGIREELRRDTRDGEVAIENRTASGDNVVAEEIRIDIGTI